MQKKPVGTERVDLFPDYHAPLSTLSARKKQLPAREGLVFAAELCFLCTVRMLGPLLLSCSFNSYVMEIEDFGGKIFLKIHKVNV